MNNLDSYTLAGHLYLWIVGEEFTNPYAGNPDQAARIVAENCWPAADDPAMAAHKIGDLESDAKWERTEESIKPRKPRLGQVVKKDDITTYQELKLSATTNSCARIAFELMFGSATKLTEAAAQFVPLSAKPKKGMLLFNAYNNEDEYVFTGAIWVRAKVSDLGSMDGRDIIKPKFEFEMIDSDLNSMAYGNEEQLTV